MACVRYLSVGCDYEINSNATEDRCGVCLGDGSSCQTIRKTFDQNEAFGYIDIDVIPKGARGIKIEEVKAAGNFLAIRSDADPEKYYLNGGFIIQWMGDYKLAGTVFHYERSGDLENLTAAGPTNETIWIQLLFQENNPGVRYEYIIQKDSPENEVETVYVWRYGNWSVCSATCGAGVQRQVARCVIKGKGVVKNFFCNPDAQPMPRQKKCNLQDCPPRWWVGDWEECSTSCGSSGIKKRTVLCIRTVGLDEQALPSEDCNHLTKPKSYLSCNRNVSCPSEWSVSSWSRCSVTCGGGVQTRNVTCPKHKKPCDPSRRPNTKALCGLQQCPLQKTSSATKAPKDLLSMPFSTTTAPSKISIEDDFRINEIPNSTHFNIHHKYNFVLVANNKKKRKGNLSNYRAKSDLEDETIRRDAESVTERNIDSSASTTPPTTSSIQSIVTPSYDFLTEQPESETNTESEEIDKFTPEPDVYYDADLDNIIESRSKRHKGRSKVTVDNHATVTHTPDSSTQLLPVATTETLPDIYSIPTLSPEHDLSTNLDHLPTMDSNSTEPPVNQSSAIYWIVGTWSECSTSCGLGAFWRHVECSTGIEDDCGHIKKPDPARRCHLRPCATWKTGNWSKCSANCGGGFMTRELQCMDIRENRPLRPFHCQSPGHNPVQNTSCNPEPCLAWLAKPWSECSKTCGSGVRKRGVICPKENRCDVKKIPILVLNCSLEPCLSWRTSNWTECSKFCGEGTQQRIVQCMTDTNQTVNQNKCEDHPKPEDSRKCHIKDCIGWKTSNWTECSTSCGKGFQQRPVHCFDASTNSTVNQSLCQKEPMPQDTKECHIRDCASWTTSNWTECSVSCGEGFQQRTVQCLNSDSNKTINQSMCEKKLKPPETKKCHNAACTHWRASDWAECSVSCGEGFQQRTVECVNADNNTTVPQSQCEKEPRPLDTRECLTKACVSWRTTNWTECSVSCGEGIQQRTVHCMEMNNNETVSESQCEDQSKPEDTRTCFMQECVSWRTGNWTECSVSCGEGVQQRAIHCVATDNHSPVNQSHCEIESRPEDTRKCHIQKCASWRTSNWTECSASCGEGIQQRLVQCIDSDNILATNQSLCEEKLKPEDTRKCTNQRCTAETEAPHCRRDKLSISFCSTVRSVGRCSLKAIQTQCCSTCSRQEEPQEGG